MKAIWSGTISFGLIHIPIKLYSASAEGRLGFRMLRRKDLCPIKYLKICRSTGEEVKQEEIAKGYEYRKGDYVILEDEDFQRASPKKSSTIEVFQFVDKKEIGEELFVKPYYVEAEKSAEKAYVLLREALKKSGKIGMAKFVMRDKEHLAAIVPKGNILMIEILRFKEELKDPEELNVPKEAKYQKKELDIALELIKHMTEPFEPEKIKDSYKEELKKIVEKKAKGKTYKPREEVEAYPTEVGDIMEQLKKSLESARKTNR